MAEKRYVLIEDYEKIKELIPNKVFASIRNKEGSNTRETLTLSDIIKAEMPDLRENILNALDECLDGNWSKRYTADTILTLLQGGKG